MGRFGTVVCVAVVTASLALWVGCGSSVPPTPGFGVPAVIKLAPTPTTSINLGDTLQFTASALNGSKAPLTTTFSYRTTNPNIVSIADNGLACAGTWDSVVTPVICTPGGVGTAQITATVDGVVSSPTTVYVHQPIAQINILPIAILNPPFPFPTAPPFQAPECFTTLAGSTTVAQSQSFDAQAMADDSTGRPTVDISSSVGPFSWSASQPSVATVTPLNTHGIPNGQAQITAHTPGFTQITASIANTTSSPISFLACPVQSISLAVNVTGGSTINAAKGTGASIAATVVDISGNIIAPALTWTSSNTAVANVSSSGGVSSPGAGGSTITASCIAPDCNINLSPPQPIYPVSPPISANFTGTTATPFGIFVTTSNATCAADVHCTAFLIPISGSPPVVGNGLSLTSVPNMVPNSMQFLPAGNTAFLGTQKGLLAVAASASPPTVANTPTVTGKVLAVSPDGKKVIVSDTTSPVQQLFIFDTSSSTSTNFLISGATAAAFSPDSLKAFIVAGNTLYVYSTQSAFQAGPLPGPASDVAFLANGMFGYVSEPGTGFSWLATCDNPGAPLSSQIQNQAGTVSLLRPLPDGSGFVGLVPPNLTFIHAVIGGTPTASGCPIPFPSGVLSVANGVTSVDLGLGSFTPIAFLLSSDGQKVYIVVQNSGTVTVYDLASGVTTSLPLVGNPNPIAAALAPDGQTLYVSASDSKVHFVNTVSGGDVYQVPVPPSTLCTVTTGGTQPACMPDLLAVKP